jgi:hypothetical protein
MRDFWYPSMSALGMRHLARNHTTQLYESQPKPQRFSSYAPSFWKKIEHFSDVDIQ